MGYMYFILDGNLTLIEPNGTTFGDGVSSMYHADNIGDGDHQLHAFADSTGTTFEMDYFECVMSLLYSVPRIVC